MKQKAKKALSWDKVQTHSTGGGTFVRQVTELDEKLIALLGCRATSLSNPYDADAVRFVLFVLNSLSNKLKRVGTSVFHSSVDC